ncbi:carboxymuconolactone decarboxylase family protein [Chitinophaga pendula]|uniref:carboxymuconolactone decarboxylase family protein n=1 Tax=Chitinophaga TaxID=79328 RepID=UPI000BAFF99F|nr:MULTISPECIES: carboxymuconolactone decarboxylase family protein [Chitinophaga]ASZ13026.1 hypothetical protein CK934_19710 [Chitinophaga sp. MD30]UCJ09343.1 carboxymuconolactone decarboxylase family protein [Chitinophaga pendula]
MKKRLNMHNIFPDLYKHLTQIDQQIKAAGIPPLYLELIKIRTSQINGCAYCLDKHISDAIKLGEEPRKIYVLSAWHEAVNWFSAEEQAIIRLTEEIAHIGEHGISDDVYDNALQLFGEEKLAFLISAAISMNAWNRLGVGLNLHPVK